MRMKCIEEKWDGNNGKPPKYDINNYKPHYFYSDFEKLKARFLESLEESESARKKVY
jgi:hypothetical protein